MLENNKTFILERPVHINTTFIYISPFLNIDIAFDQGVSDALDSLRKITNIVFIFNKKMQNTVDIKSLSTLYRANGYIVSENDYVMQSIFYALSYFRVLYEKMLGFLVIDDLGYLKRIDIEKIGSIINSGQINSSIFNVKRMELDELKKIFINPPKQSFLDRIKGKVNLKYTSGMYSRFDMTDETVCYYLRQVFIDEIKQFLKEDFCPPYYLESFYTRYPTEFFASIAERLPDKVKVLNIEIEKINL